MRDDFEFVNPGEVPKELSSLISRTVDAFSAAQKCFSEAWYHDLPLWYVTEADPGSIKAGTYFRSVQVGVGREDNELIVEVTPDWEFIEAEGPRLRTPEIIEEGVFRTVMARELLDVPKRLEQVLFEAWERAGQLIKKEEALSPDAGNDSRRNVVIDLSRLIQP